MSDQTFKICPNCGGHHTITACSYALTPSSLAAMPGLVNPLTPYEAAQLEAALVLLSRRDHELAEKVLNAAGRNAALALELQAYIRANSPNDKSSHREK